MLTAMPSNPALAHSVGSLLTVNAIPSLRAAALAPVYEVAQHSLARSLAFHLAPAALMAAILPAVGPRVLAAGFPPALALTLVALTALLPLMYATLSYGAYKRKTTDTLGGIVAYRRPMPWVDALAGLLLVTLWGGLCLHTFGPLDAWWQSLLPAWARIGDFGILAAAPLGRRVLAAVLLFTVNGLALPLYQELYYRGFLLPRIERLGNWAPFASLGLFALGGTLLPSQVIALLPAVWLVWRNRNIHLGIAIRILLGSVALAAALPVIFG